METSVNRVTLHELGKLGRARRPHDSSSFLASQDAAQETDAWNQTEANGRKDRQTNGGKRTFTHAIPVSHLSPTFSMTLFHKPEPVAAQ